MLASSTLMFYTLWYDMRVKRHPMTWRALFVCPYPLAAAVAVGIPRAHSPRPRVPTPPPWAAAAALAARRHRGRRRREATGRDLHSSTFQLNLSRF